MMWLLGGVYSSSWQLWRTSGPCSRQHWHSVPRTWHDRPTRLPRVWWLRVMSARCRQHGDRGQRIVSWLLV